MESNLTKLTAAQTAAAIADGRCSAREVAGSFLDRIGAVDPTLNAILEVNPEAMEIVRPAGQGKVPAGEFAATAGLQVGYRF